MKKLILFLLLLNHSFGQAQTTLANKLKITGNTTDNAATKVVVQSTNNVLNTISKTDLQDVFYFATASALPVVGITDKLYITRDDNKLYRFNGTIYVPLNEINFIKSNEPLSLAQRNGDFLYGILDQYTGEEVILKKTTDTNTVDGIIYFQLGDEKFKRNFTFLRPEWFGLDGVNDQIAINLALSVNNEEINTSSVVKLFFGKEYNCSAPIEITAFQTLDCSGAIINSTSNTSVIKGVDSLLSNVFQHKGVNIINPNIVTYTAEKGIDLMGFKNSKILNPKIKIFNTDANSVGLDLRHGSQVFEQCYFNEIDNPDIYLENNGTGIWIRGVDGISGANINIIKGGIVSGNDMYGIRISNNSNGNTIIGLDCEHYTDFNPTRIAYFIESNFNNILSPHIESYTTGIKITGNGNKISIASIVNATDSYVDLGGSNIYEGISDDVTRNIISIGGGNEVGGFANLIVASEVFPSIRIDSKNASSDSRNYSLDAGNNGSTFGLRVSNLKGGEPISDGFDIFRVNLAKNLDILRKTKIQASFGSSLEVVGEGNGEEIIQTKSLGSGFGVNAFYGDFGNKGAMWLGQYKDGKGIIWNNTNHPLGFFINGTENFTMNVDGTTSFNFGVSVNGNITASPATLANQVPTLGQVQSLDSGNIKTTGNQTGITGTKSFSNSTNTSTLNLNLANNAQGFVANNANTSTAFVANNTGTGFSYVGQNNGVNTFIVDKFGVVTLVGGTALNNAVPRSQLLYTNQTITANKTVTIAEFVNNNELILSVNATSGNITITLPTFTALQGYKVTVKKMDSSANSVLIQGVGGVNIDDAPTLVISGKNGSATVGANLTQYIIL